VPLISASLSSIQEESGILQADLDTLSMSSSIAAYQTSSGTLTSQIGDVDTYLDNYSAAVVTSSQSLDLIDTQVVGFSNSVDSLTSQSANMQAVVDSGYATSSIAAYETSSTTLQSALGDVEAYLGDFSSWSETIVSSQLALYSSQEPFSSSISSLNQDSAAVQANIDTQYNLSSIASYESDSVALTSAASDVQTYLNNFSSSHAADFQESSDLAVSSAAVQGLYDAYMGDYSSYYNLAAEYQSSLDAGGLSWEEESSLSAARDEAYAQGDTASQSADAISLNSLAPVSASLETVNETLTGASITSSIDSYLSSSGELTSSLGDVDLVLDAFSAAMAPSSASLTSINNQKAAYEASIGSLGSDVVSLALDIATASNTSSISAYNTSSTNLTSQINSVSAYINDFNTANAEALASLGGIDTSITAFGNSITSLQTDSTSIEGDIAAAFTASSIDSYQASSTTLEAALTGVTDYLANFSSVNSASLSTLAALASSKSALSDSSSAISTSILDTQSVSSALDSSFSYGWFLTAEQSGAISSSLTNDIAPALIAVGNLITQEQGSQLALNAESEAVGSSIEAERTTSNVAAYETSSTDLLTSITSQGGIIANQQSSIDSVITPALNSLSAEIDTAAATLNTLSASISELSSSADVVSAGIVTVNTSLSSTRSSSSSAQSLLASYVSTFNSLQSNLSSLSADIEEAEFSINTGAASREPEPLQAVTSTYTSRLKISFGGETGIADISEILAGQFAQAQALANNNELAIGTALDEAQQQDQSTMLSAVTSPTDNAQSALLRTESKAGEIAEILAKALRENPLQAYAAIGELDSERVTKLLVDSDLLNNSLKV
jgi:predicted  nucleic acid-binding Zn-ribbon protein